MSPFTSSKVGVYNKNSKFTLSADYSKIVIEIHKDKELISRIQYPNTPSGLSYAKRVFNSLE